MIRKLFMLTSIVVMTMVHANAAQNTQKKEDEVVTVRKAEIRQLEQKIESFEEALKKPLSPDDKKNLEINAIEARYILVKFRLPNNSTFQEKLKTFSEFNTKAFDKLNKTLGSAFDDNFNIAVDNLERDSGGKLIKYNISVSRLKSLVNDLVTSAQKISDVISAPNNEERCQELVNDFESFTDASSTCNPSNYRTLDFLWDSWKILIYFNMLK